MWSRWEVVWSRWEVVWSGWEVVWSGWEVVWSGVEFHFSLRATRDWKSESVTDLLTYLLSYMGRC